jgi:hypothetical protein
VRILFAIILSWVALPGFGQDSDGETSAGGEVRVPLPAYTRLLEESRQEPRPAPVAYALGQAEVAIKVKELDDRIIAQVDVTLRVETFAASWTLVPLLPSSVALSRATVDGQPVALTQSPEGLAWSTDQATAVTFKLSYGIDARRSETGFILSVPVPRAAATTLRLEQPGTRLDIAVVPAADLQSMQQGDGTLTTASIPATSAILISWRARGKRPPVISRAHYRGELREDAILWAADYQVELFSGEWVTLPLLPTRVTLSDIQVDGQSATILNQDDHFATLLQGQGLHAVRVAFETPVVQQDGPPQVQVALPRVPVSRFDLALPGRKELKVVPQTNVVTHEQEGQTRATVFLPLGDQVVFSWVDAVPEDLRTQVRANAGLYHLLQAEEGVLHGQAIIAYEITHGEANLLELSVPQDVQVNRITAAEGGISDWSVVSSTDQGTNVIKVFLERAVQGEYGLTVFYERLLGAGSKRGAPLPVPLLQALNVHRQRGMVALLAGPELALEPVEQERISAVGENELPAFVRNQTGMTIAHTYKYLDQAARLVVKAVTPERQQGKFDAQIDTLISIGEVTLKGSAGVAINVKSGSLMALPLTLPENVNVLGVTGPSLRSHQVETADHQQVIRLEFTQEMAGQFRVEVNYERIMTDSAGEVQVPTLAVEGAEVEHGRVAVEALTAVEVSTAVAEQLSSLDMNELPQQLVLKTTNPILLAYKYVRSEAPYQLALKITRHQEIDVQVAAIEQADYQTLVTSDGLAVTTARFTVRNSRRQFLRLELPSDAKIWSVFVDGKAEKPAHAGAGDPTVVLIKMINSVSGFPIEVIYTTPVPRMGVFGAVSGQLPQPDMVVTHTHWDVFLPIHYRYQEPDSNLDLVVQGRWVNPRSTVAASVAGTVEAGREQFGQALRMSVPTQGIRFTFEKLYANQSAQAAAFTLRYVSSAGNRLGLWLSGLGTLLLWAGILALGSRRAVAPNKAIGIGMGLGVVLVVAGIGLLGASPALAAGLTLAIAIILPGWLGLRRWRDRRPLLS